MKIFLLVLLTIGNLSAGWMNVDSINVKQKWRNKKFNTNALLYVKSADSLMDTCNVYYSSGSIGIGISSPSYLLHVNGDGYFDTDLYVQNDITLDGVLSAQDYAVVSNYLTVGDGAFPLQITPHASAPYTGTNQNYIVTTNSFAGLSNGSMALQTGSLASGKSIAFLGGTTGKITAQIFDTTSFNIFTDSTNISGDLYLEGNLFGDNILLSKLEVDTLVVNDSIYNAGNSYLVGNVGINTTDPDRLLDVNGQIKANGDCPVTIESDDYSATGSSIYFMNNFGSGTGKASKITTYDDPWNIGNLLFMTKDSSFFETDVDVAALAYDTAMCILSNGVIIIGDTANYDQPAGFNVYPESYFNQDVYIDDTLYVNDFVTINNNLHVTDTLTVDDSIYLNGSERITNDLYVDDDLTVGGDMSISGNLSFGTLTADSIYVSGSYIGNSGQMYIAGTSTLNDALIVNGTTELNDAVTINATTGIGTNYINNTGALLKGIRFDASNRLEAYNTGGAYGDIKYSVALWDDASYAAGVGGGVLFGGKDSSDGSYATFAGIRGYKATAADGNNAGQLHFQTKNHDVNPVTQMIINQVGQIGMGQSPSTDRLEVNGTTNTDSLYVSGDGYLASNLSIGSNTQNLKLTVRTDVSDDGIILERLDGTDIVRIFKDASSSDARIDMSSGGVATIQLKANGISHFSGGNVGIGTISPADRLEVNGTTNTDSLYVSGDSYLARQLGIRNSHSNDFNFSNGGVLVIGDTNITSSQISLISSGESYIAYGDTVAGTMRYSGMISYDHTSKKMGFRTNASNRVTIDSIGSVGIGTSSPSCELDITDVSGQALLHIDAATNQDAMIQFYENGVDQFRLWSDFDNANGMLRFYDAVASSDRMVIATDGDVGINTTSPAYKLDVSGVIHTNSNLYLDNNNSISQFNSTGTLRQILALNDHNYLKVGGVVDSGIIFYSNLGNPRMYIAHSGNVGIDVSDPDQKLEVNGAIKSSGTSDQLQIQGYDQTAKTWRFGTNTGNSGANPNLTLWYTDTSNVMLFDTVGNVGIGTVTPDAKLTIADDNFTTRIRPNQFDMLAVSTDQLHATIFSLPGYAGVSAIHRFLSFDPSTEEGGATTVGIPAEAKDTLYVSLLTLNTAGGSGTYVFKMYYELLGVGNTLSTTMTDSLHVVTAATTADVIDTMVLGKIPIQSNTTGLAIHLSRDATTASDNYTSDILVPLILFEYNVDKLGDESYTWE